MNRSIPTRPDPFLDPTPTTSGRVVIFRVLLICAVTVTATAILLLSARTAPTVGAGTAPAQASPFDTAPAFHPNDLPFVSITAGCDGEDVIGVIADVPADQIDLGKQVKVRIDGTIVDSALPVFTLGQYTVPHAPSHTVEIAYFWPGNVEPFGSPVIVSAEAPTDCTTSTTIAPVAPSTTTAPSPTSTAAPAVGSGATPGGPPPATPGGSPAATLPRTV